MDSIFLTLSGSERRDEQTVMMSMGQVSNLLRASLAERGVKFFESSDGDVVHFKGQTQTGKQFEFILESEKRMGGAATQVVFEGDKEAETLWFAAISAMVNGSSAQQPRPPMSAGPAPTQGARP